MPFFRIALAQLPFPGSPQASVRAAEEAIAQAGRAEAGLVCFPECFVPGYRLAGREVAPPDRAFLESAWSAIAVAAARAQVAVVLGSERFVGDDLRITALVLGPDGSRLGWQDKVQLDPSEDAMFRPGAERQVFRTGPLTFGVAICHEGFRYPETVRWAARHGAQVVFHPHLHEVDPGGHRPARFADPESSFHDAAALCRAAENTVFYATVNYALPESGTATAVIRPDGTLLERQPHGEPGVLVVDLDLGAATGRLASRLRA